ncbi:MAG: flavodoxin domain-containing protein [Candidatus Hodarchaeota archaeon]
MKIGIIYGTRRKEATVQIVAWLKAALEEKGFIVVTGKPKEFQNFDCDGYIVGTAVYAFSIRWTRILNFLKAKQDQFQQKPLATFIVHGYTDPKKQLNNISKQLPSEPVTQAVFKGYYNEVEFRNWDSNAQKSKAVEWATEIEMKFSNIWKNLTKKSEEINILTEPSVIQPK